MIVNIKVMIQYSLASSNKHVGAWEFMQSTHHVGKVICDTDNVNFHEPMAICFLFLQDAIHATVLLLVTASFLVAVRAGCSGACRERVDIFDVETVVSTSSGTLTARLFILVLRIDRSREAPLAAIVVGKHQLSSEASFRSSFFSTNFQRGGVLMMDGFMK